MLVFLFAGEKILAFLSLRAETVSISGGIILFLIAIKMIFPSASGNSSGLPAGEEPFIVPLAIPLVAGPTILATLMLLSHQYPNQMGHLVIALLLARVAPLSSCYSLRYFTSAGRERGERT